MLLYEKTNYFVCWSYEEIRSKWGRFCCFLHVTTIRPTFQCSRLFIHLYLFRRIVLYLYNFFKGVWGNRKGQERELKIHKIKEENWKYCNTYQNGILINSWCTLSTMSVIISYLKKKFLSYKFFIRSQIWCRIAVLSLFITILQKYFSMSFHQSKTFLACTQIFIF